jgi:integrase
MHRLKTGSPKKSGSSGAAKTAAAYWMGKVKKPAGSGLYGVQIAYHGTRHRFPLETANQTAAAEKARNIYLSLVANGVEATMATIKPKTVKAARIATIGEWVEKVRATTDLRPDTLKNYAKSLRQIASGISDIGDQPALDENGTPRRDKKRHPIILSRFDYKTGGCEAWLAKVNALPLSVLSAVAVQKWKLDYIARAGSAPDASRRAQNSARSLMRCARCLFSETAREFASKELTLPDPLPFNGVKLPKEGNTNYKSRIDAGTLITAARAELTGELFKIFTLGLLCGLRKREIDLLTWNQVDFGKGVVRIEATEYFLFKSEDSAGEVDLDPETIALLRGWKATATGPFVIESTKPFRHNAHRSWCRCSRHFKPLYVWLKKQGITAQKPLHELRKELGAVLASTQGIYAAQLTLRHARISTTASYYTDKKRRITADLGALLSPAPETVIEGDFKPKDDATTTTAPKAPRKAKKEAGA